MKLRFRGNSLRIRVNRREVEALAAGRALQERITFPGDTELAYSLHSQTITEPAASFQNGSIQVLAPREAVAAWAAGDDIGLYFDLPANGSSLSVLIEKDLECVDGPSSERDPDAFTRSGKNC
jgi:hypothetical protein